jgi:hypothetical protein
MLFKKPLDEILGQLSKLKLLRYMINTGAEMNGSTLARAVGLSHVKCNTALQELAKHGVVVYSRIGNSILYKLEKKHILYTDFLKPLFEKENKIFDELTTMINKYFKKTKPLSLAVFGSNAALKARPESDIDLLVVIPNKMSVKVATELLDSAVDESFCKFGNGLSPIIITQKEFQKKHKREVSLYTNIMKNHKLIFGKTLLELLN